MDGTPWVFLVTLGAACGVACSAEPRAPEAVEAPAPPVAGVEAHRPGPASPQRAHVDISPAPPATANRDVVELQTGRRFETIDIRGPAGRRGSATLVDLQPNVSGWLLLELEWEGGERDAAHLSVAESRRGTVRLDAARGTGLLVGEPEVEVCELWGHSSALEAARREGRPFAPLCGGAIFLRNPTVGHRTSKEWLTDFLRDRIPAGEAVTSLVKETVFRDAFLAHADLERAPDAVAVRKRPSGAPQPAAIDRRFEASAFSPVDLGLSLEVADPEGRLLVGRWYQSRLHEGIFVSAVEPRVLDGTVFDSLKGTISPLDEVEAGALTYLVAFDLGKYSIGFSVGTDHPRVGWSERVAPDLVVPGLAGPDGFVDVAPLVRVGRLRPDLASRVAATFVGGFKRSHGAFKSGELSRVERGSHYGFVEEGVVLSALRPGLATVVVDLDGDLDLRTWSRDDDSRLGEVRFARQNGVPILERDPATGAVRAGTLVTRWGDGNWSGSQDKKFRTLRSGLCLQETDAGRFLLYGYFSSVTPSAMAAVFQAYGCEYAMLLDMNALEHTYLALYDHSSDVLGVEHLHTGMSVLDQTYEGYVVPRFVGYPDNRDFFYVQARRAS